jgi:malate dehydrogenase (oxaloacetate-decarboxylating)(NADP+)
VAKAAMDSNIAQLKIEDWDQYEIELEERLGIDHRLISRIITRAKKDPKRVIFGEAHDVSILKAAQQVVDQGIAIPILLGNVTLINSLIKENDLDLKNCEIIDPLDEVSKRADFASKLFALRQRKGMTHQGAQEAMLNSNYFGVMMVNIGAADAFISGLSNDYPETIRPALEIIGAEEGIKRVAGMYILSNKKGNYFLSDTTVNLNPTQDQLVDIMGLTARAVRFFDVEPRMAGLSYSNFGSAKGEVPEKMAKAVAQAKKQWPDLLIDGEIQANVALNKEILQESYPFSKLAGTFANTLIFPNLESGNIAYKLLMEFGGAEAIGPILMGMRKPIHVLQRGSSVSDIFNMTAIAVVDAQVAAKKDQK